MGDIVIPNYLGNFPHLDKEKDKEIIIKAKKSFSEMHRNSEKNAKLSKCYYCGKDCSSFCNSHSMPRCFLKNIAEDGKVLYSNSLLEFPLLNYDNGLNQAGTFKLICNQCDSEIFKDYENESNYQNQPSQKMLTQIDLKNVLKKISKRLEEVEQYKINESLGRISSDEFNKRMKVAQLDLDEDNKIFRNIKNSILTSDYNNYIVGYFVKLNYKVPLAFQANICLICDLEGNIINDIHDYTPQNKMKEITLCVFPLKETSIIIIFFNKKYKIYSRFCKHLKQIKSLEEQLSLINYIIFLYSEEFFISPKISKDTLEGLNIAFEVTSDLIQFKEHDNNNSEYDLKRQLKEIYDLDSRNIIPNILSREFALNKVK